MSTRKFHCSSDLGESYYCLNYLFAVLFIHFVIKGQKTALTNMFKLTLKCRQGIEFQQKNKTEKVGKSGFVPFLILESFIYLIKVGV